jgi:hypothetical protein
VLTRNALVAAGRDVLVEYTCDDELRCRYQVVDRLRGTTRPIDLGQAQRSPWVSFGVLSPDDRWLLLPDVPQSEFGRAILVDLVEGSTSEVELRRDSTSDRRQPAQPVWSHDSRWLFWIDRGVGLSAMDLETRAVHRVGEGTILDDLTGLVLVPLDA